MYVLATFYVKKNDAINTRLVSRNMCGKLCANWFCKFQNFWVQTNSQYFLYVKEERLI